LHQKYAVVNIIKSKGIGISMKKEKEVMEDGLTGSKW